MAQEDISTALRNVKKYQHDEENVPSPTGGFFISRTAIFQMRASF
jgi:hypothetical protein